MTYVPLKVCTICKEVKLQSEFNKKKRSKDGLQNTCKLCSRESFKRYWTANKNKHAAVVRKRSIEARRLALQYCVDYAIQQGCVDCKETDPACLDFDHVKGQKSLAISEMHNQGYSITRIQQEIDKCVVRCANCHRKKTAKDQQWYRKIKLDP